MKKCILFFVTLILCFLFTGCYAQSEPSDYTHVLAVGVDKGEDGNYIFSFLAPQETGEETLSHTNTLITVSAPSFGQAESIANFYNNRTINVTHLHLILFSKEAALDTLEPVIMSFANYQKLRPLISVGITDGRAADYLKGIDQGVTQPLPDFLQTFVTNSSRIFAPLESLHKLYAQFESKSYALALPLFINDTETTGSAVPSKNPPLQSAANVSENAVAVSASGEDEKSEVTTPLEFGMVIIKDFKAEATLGGIDTLYYNMVTGRLPYTYTNIDAITKNPDFSIFIKKRSDPVIDIDASTDSPKINITLEFDNYTITGYGAAHKDLDGALSDAAKVLEAEITDFLYRTSREYNTDIFGFYAKLSPKYKNIDDYAAYDWEIHYPKAEFDVTVKIRSSNVAYPKKILPDLTKGAH